MGQGRWALRLQGGGGWPAGQGRLEPPLLFSPGPTNAGPGASSESEVCTLGRHGAPAEAWPCAGLGGYRTARELAVWSWGPAGGEDAARTEPQNTPNGRAASSASAKACLRVVRRIDGKHTQGSAHTCLTVDLRFLAAERLLGGCAGGCEVRGPE